MSPVLYKSCWVSSWPCTPEINIWLSAPYSPRLCTSTPRVNMFLFLMLAVPLFINKTILGVWNCVLQGVTRGLQGWPQSETLADGNWLVKQNQPVSKIETKSDTYLRSLYESWFRNPLIDLKISDTVMKSQERNKFRARRSKRTQSLKHSFKKVFANRALAIVPWCTQWGAH